MFNVHYISIFSILMNLYKPLVSAKYVSSKNIKYEFKKIIENLFVLDT